MITPKDRNLVKLMIKHNLWGLKSNMRLLDVTTCWGTKWILKRMLERQVVDNLHHAPCCPANHYHNTRLVFTRCTCGAKS